jgi:hypothetical protein
MFDVDRRLQKNVPKFIDSEEEALKEFETAINNDEETIQKVQHAYLILEWFQKNSNQKSSFLESLTK